MTPTKNLETLERQFARKGVEVEQVAETADELLVAVGFRCRECGTAFCPPADRLKNRHVCPQGCNK